MKGSIVIKRTSPSPGLFYIFFRCCPDRIGAALYYLDVEDRQVVDSDAIGAIVTIGKNPEKVISFV